MALLAVVVMAAMAGGQAAAAGTSMDDRGRAFIAAEERAEDAVVALTDKKFREMVGPTEERPFDTVIFFTANHLRSKAGLGLDYLRKEFSAVAQSHRREHGSKNSAVRFAEAEVNSAQGVFAALGVNSLPHVAILPGNATLSADKGSIEIAASLRLTESGHEMDRDGMAQFVQEGTGQGVAKAREDSFRDWKLFPFAMLSLVALALRGVVAAVRSGAATSRSAWLTGSALVWWFSMSGGMYNIIRKVPVYQVDPRTGSKVFFTKSFGVQLGAEGMYIAASYLVAGFAVVVLTHVAPLISYKALQRIAAYLCAFFFAASSVTAHSLYQAKTGYPLRVVGWQS